MKKLTDKIIETAANVVEDNNKIFDSLETERMSLVREIAGEVIQYMNDFVADRKLNEEEKNMLVQTIIDDLNNEFEENGELSGEDDVDIVELERGDVIESGYGTSHLKQQSASLGQIVDVPEHLQINTSYCIVDLGLNEWNSGYKYLGYNDFNGTKYHQFQNTLEPHQLGEPDMFTHEEIIDMIDNSQIAFEEA